MYKIVRMKKIITLLIDIFLMNIAFIITLLIRYQNIEIVKRVFLIGIKSFVIVFLLQIFVLYIVGLYSLLDLRFFSKRIQKTISSCIISAGLAFFFFYLVQIPNFKPKTIMFIYMLIFNIFFILWRNYANNILLNIYPQVKVGFFGWSDLIEELIQNKEIKQAFNIDFKMIVSNLSISEGFRNKFRNDIVFLKSEEELDEWLKKGEIDILVLSSELKRTSKVTNLLFNNLSTRTAYTSMPVFYETMLTRIPLDSINQMWFLEHLNLASKASYEKIKRVMDLFFGILLFTVTLPIWPIIMLLVKLSSRGPIFFTQIRMGKNLKLFKIFKFRTMKIENNDYSITKENDDRITKISSFLRKTRLDELPQLINIIKGEMSFVGPRPERPEIVKMLEEEVPFYNQRMLVIPGLTGWDQISGEYHSASVEDTYKKLQYDLYYVKNRSLYLDLSIVLRTFFIMISRIGR